MSDTLPTPDLPVNAIQRRRFLGIPIPGVHRNAWKTALTGSSLPQPIGTLITRVIRSTRLWPSEKLDVTRELIAHFKDALAAGASPEAACDRFGNPKAAAKLIRRAAFRKRPWWWQVRRNANRAIAAALLLILCVYAWFGLLAIIGRPSIKRFYAAEHNQSILFTPEPERAWPLYVRASELLGPLPASLIVETREGVEPLRRADGFPQSWPYMPGDAKWTEACAWVDAHRDAISLIHTAARRPVFGAPFLVSVHEEHSLAPMTADGIDLSAFKLADASTPLIDVRIAESGQLRHFARVLIVEARHAAELGDQDRAVTAIESIVGMARHVGQGDLLIQEFFANVLATQACLITNELIAHGGFTPANLTRLSRAIERIDDATVATTFAGEKLFMLDMLQRCYTDDGSGDGRLTAAGLRLIRDIEHNANPNSQDPLIPALFNAALAPAIIAATATRAETWSLCERGYNAAAAESKTPLWQRGDSTLDTDIVQLRDGWRQMRRVHLIPMLLFPALGRASLAPETTLQYRDATLTALALEQYRLANDRYPTKLDDLVPDFLSGGLLPDRYDGTPLKYALTSPTTPILYSIGTDRIDDGGRGPSDPQRDAEVQSFRSPARIASMLGQPGGSSWLRGDWLLYDPARLQPRMPLPPPPPPPVRPRFSAPAPSSSAPGNAQAPATDTPAPGASSN
jgi:hypothetical protein